MREGLFTQGLRKAGVRLLMSGERSGSNLHTLGKKPVKKVSWRVCCWARFHSLQRDRHVFLTLLTLNRRRRASYFRKHCVGCWVFEGASYFARSRRPEDRPGYALTTSKELLVLKADPNASVFFSQAKCTHGDWRLQGPKEPTNI